MLFNSFEYILFLVIVFTAFWALVRFKLLSTVLLLIASFVFYMAWNATFIILIIASTLADYIVGLCLSKADKPRARKALLASSLIFNLGLLALFKYADFFIGATVDVAGVLGFELHPTYLRLILPVGISFYTFQSLSYTIDVYRKKIEPTKNFVEFAMYVAFFPQLVAGPIVRAKEFLPQFKHKPTLSRQQAGEAIYLIILGMFKKVVIADYLAANLIDRVFDNPGGFSSAEAWLATYAYCWQLYGDFSGYTDIARGSAKLFGFELPENFERPFRATGPLEFWRTWHMTLGRWVQDYIYLPLGGSRYGRFRTYCNLFVCFMAVGLWHGAGWAYVLFALYQSIGVTINRIWRDIKGVKGPPSFGVKAVLLCICNYFFFVFAWTIFRPASLDQMYSLWNQMFLANEWWPMRIGVWAWIILITMPIIHFTPVRWEEQARDHFSRMPAPAQALIVLIVGALVMYVGSRQPSPFIYFQF